MVDVNEYLDYRTGRFFNANDDWSLMSECTDYCLSLINELSHMFGDVQPHFDRLVVVNTLAMPTELFGSHWILNGGLKSALKTCKKDSDLYPYLKELEKIYSKLLKNLYPQEEEIQETINKTKPLIDAIKRYYEAICTDCANGSCKELVRQLLENDVFLNYITGTFSAGSNVPIILYPISMAKITHSPEAFNAQFWSTLAHEVFHLYHFLSCSVNSPDKYHWWDGQWPYQTNREDEHLPRGEENRRMNPNQITDGNPCFCHGPVTVEEIVKESLADYYCYYQDVFDLNSILPSAEKIAERRKADWYKHSVFTWPYAGARAFLPDGKNIAGESLFREVFSKSLFDWDDACKAIISHL